MSDIIHLLPDSIANQIAAGEVVQRPASVVKELLENSIDAGAGQITLIVKDAGKALLQILDDGQGMSPTDARMSLERHATSKIKTANDLYALRTMGFRGEALASIVAVAQVEIKTRQSSQEAGTLLVVEGSVVKKQELTACDKGTSIAVKNLFFNVPARRQFLKSNAREWEHIAEEFTRLALARPDIGFKLINEQETVYDLSASKLSQRIVSLFGKTHQSQLIPCQEEATSITIAGYVGKPELAKKKRGNQYLFVNQRFVKNGYLHHAIVKAYEGLLAENAHPFYALFISIDPRRIDVNVHPTKTEIKFDDDNTVYGIVWSAVKKALGTAVLSPTMDFSADINLMNKVVESPDKHQALIHQERFGSFPKTNTLLPTWEKLYGDTPASPSLGGSAVASLYSRINEETAPEEETKPQALFQWQQQFIIAGMKETLLIIDQEAAHERILFEKFMRRFQAPAASQQLLFPEAITVAASDMVLLEEMRPELHALGFRIEDFGKNSILVNGIPAEISIMEKGLLEDLLAQFKENQTQLRLPLQDNVARVLARRSCIKAGKTLQIPEMESLLASLFACRTPRFSPDGRAAYAVLDKSNILSYFVTQNL